MSGQIRIDSSAPRTHTHDGIGGIPQVDYGNLLNVPAAKRIELVIDLYAPNGYVSTYTGSYADMYRQSFLYTPGNYTGVVEAYFETNMYSSGAASTGRLTLRSRLVSNGSVADIISAAPVGTTQDNPASTVRSADILASLPATPALLFIGRTAAASPNDLIVNGARLILVCEV